MPPGAATAQGKRIIALNLLKADKTVKIGINGKRLKAGWDTEYLLKILQI